MIVGMSTKENDVDVNAIKGKHLTNTRSANKDMKITMTPAVKMSLEQALDFIEDDELLEITPISIRMRKRVLDKTERLKYSRSHRSA